MNVPAFTADASLYKTSTHYFFSTSSASESTPTGSLVIAQAGERFAGCDACEVNCVWTNVKCEAAASAVYAGAAIGCAALIFPPAIAVCEGVAAGIYAAAIGGCYAWNGECEVECWWPGGPCCPVFCELGHCCSEGETCIPHGCCPNDQTICNGTCCDKGWTCCGDTCCPPNYFCRDGGFCSEFPSDLLPPKGAPSATPPARPKRGVICLNGTPCVDKCCAPGLQCCSVGKGEVACLTNCLH